MQNLTDLIDYLDTFFHNTFLYTLRNFFYAVLFPWVAFFLLWIGALTYKEKIIDGFLGRIAFYGSQYGFFILSLAILLIVVGFSLVCINCYMEDKPKNIICKRYIRKIVVLGFIASCFLTLGCFALIEGNSLLHFNQRAVVCTLGIWASVGAFGFTSTLREQKAEATKPDTQEILELQEKLLAGSEGQEDMLSSYHSHG